MGKPASSAVLAAIVTGGLIAGALDFAGACLIYGLGPDVIGKAVAAGVLGPATFEGGIANSWLGAGLHFAISIVAAGVYVCASLSFPILWSRAVIGGVVFGFCMFMAMNFIIVPLSLAASHQPFNWARKWPDLIAHMAFFGPSVSLTAERLLGKPVHGKPA